MLRGLFRRIFELPGPSATDGYRATAGELQRLAPKCLVCSAELTAHRFAQIGSTPWTEETKHRVATLIQHLQNHEWESLKDFTDFRADQDDAVVYAILGPHDSGMVVLVHDPFELFAAGELCLKEIVMPDEVLRITSLVRDDAWREF